LELKFLSLFGSLFLLFLFNFIRTVKLGYNELGYNKLPLITNKTFDLSGLGYFNTHFSRL
jgi:hypothetical protein